MFVYGAREEWETQWKRAVQIIFNKADIPNVVLPPGAASLSIKHTADPCCFEKRVSILTLQSPRRGRKWCLEGSSCHSHYRACLSTFIASDTNLYTWGTMQ